MWRGKKKKQQTTDTINLATQADLDALAAFAAVTFVVCACIGYWQHKLNMKSDDEL